MAPKIIGSVFKDKQDTMTGLWLEEMDDETIRIQKIDRDGLFSKTSLNAGMKVISINDNPLHGNDLLHAYDLMRATKGELKIVATWPSVKANPVNNPVPIVTSVKYGNMRSTTRRVAATIPATIPATDIKAKAGTFSSNRTPITTPVEVSPALSGGVIPSNSATVLNNESGSSRVMFISNRPLPHRPQENPPPPGCQDGGIWGLNKYWGCVSCVYGAFDNCGISTSKSVDVRPAYLVEGWVSDFD